MTEQNDAVGRLGRNNRLSLIGSVVNGAVGFIVILVLTRGLGTDGAGVVFIAAAVFNIAMQTAVIGTDASLVRFIAQDRKAGRLGSIAPLLRAAIKPVLGIGIVLGVIVGIFAEPIGDLVNGDDPVDSDVTTAIRIVAVVFPLGALAMSLLAATRGFGQLRTTAGYNQIARPLIQLAALILVVVTDAGPAAATAAWIGPVIIPGLASVAWLRKEMPESDGAPVDMKEFWSFTRPHAGTGALRVSIRWLDTLIVAALLGPAAAGIYTTATRFLKLGDFFNQATFQAAAPQIAEDLGTGNVHQAMSVYRSASTWLMLSTWPLYLGTILYAPEMLRIFGEEFVEGAPALRILAATMLVASASGPIEAVLVMSGATTKNLINNITALTLNIVLGFVLIPPFGLEGAAIAWAVSLLCTNLLPLAQVYQSLRIHPFSSTHVKTMAAVAAGFVVTSIPVRAFGLPPFVTLVVGIALGVIPWAAFAFWRRDELALEQLIRSRKPKKKPELAQEQS